VGSADTVEETSIQAELKTGTEVVAEGIHSFRRCGRQAQKQTKNVLDRSVTFNRFMGGSIGWFSKFQYGSGAAVLAGSVSFNMVRGRQYWLVQ
jgi:hypothetical protein